MNGTTNNALFAGPRGWRVLGTALGSLGAVGAVLWLGATAAHAGAPCYPTMTDEQGTCDGVDNDCDGATDEKYDDGVACTLSQCINGVAQNVPNNALCDDGESCTMDFCKPSLGTPDGCVHVALPSATPNPAQDDGNPCTDLRCVNGHTENVPDDTNVPDDGLWCTTDACVGGVAQHDLAADACLIDGTCVAAGTVGQQGTCGVCSPSVSQTTLQTLAYREDFEGSTSGWQSETLSGTATWHVTTDRALSPSHSLYMGTSDHVYGNSTYDFLCSIGSLTQWICHQWAVGSRVRNRVTSPTIALPNAAALSLDFALWLQTEEDPNYDILTVEIIANGTVDTLWSSSSINGTTNNKWRFVHLDVGAYAGDDVQIRFSFDSIDGTMNYFEGAYIDDIAISMSCCQTADDCNDGNDCTVDICRSTGCDHYDTCSPTCQLRRPNMMMTLDYSGSMGPECVRWFCFWWWCICLEEDTVNPSKWEMAVDAIGQTLRAMGPALNVALKLFRTPSYGGSCEVNPSSLEVGWGATATQVSSYLGSLAPNGATPMGSALQKARGIYNNSVYTADKYVLLITDGMDTCGGDPVQAVQDLRADGVDTFVVGFGTGVDKNVLNAAAFAGGHPKDIQAAADAAYWEANNAGDLQQAIAAIIAEATGEICNGIDDDCDGQVDEGLGTESCSVTCNGVVLNGYRSCVDGVMSPCQLPAVTEVCDTQDNNCNGQVDENWKTGPGPRLGDTCFVGLGACTRQGTYVCATDGVSAPVCSATAGPSAPESCDGVDNDCDGLTDEGLNRQCSSDCGVGVESCVNGQYQGCTAPTNCPKDVECNNIDEDGDGITDNNFPLRGTACDGADSDLCLNGTWTCTADTTGLECVNESPADIQEQCNGVDDDCDGVVDEEGALGCTDYFLDQDGDGFGVGTPRCLCEATAQFRALQGGDCADDNAFIHPGAPETCDGLDNDCDALVDEDPVNATETMHRPCYTGPGGTQGIGVCAGGTEVCMGAAGWSACVGEITPSTEVCDGYDNDCDSHVDEDPADPAAFMTQSCYGGPQGTAGVGVCAAGTRQCQGANGQAIWTPCSGAVLPSPETCDGLDNDCDSQTDEDPHTGKALEQPCYTGPPGTEGVGLCAAGTQACLGAQGWGACEGDVTPTTETCDGYDQDCDGVADNDEYDPTNPACLDPNDPSCTDPCAGDAVCGDTGHCECQAWPDGTWQCVLE